MELTNQRGLPVVYDGVGKDTLQKSLDCLSIRGTMVSFGNASGLVSDLNVFKMLQPKGIYFVRPSMGQYFGTREELDEAANVMFKKIRSQEVKVDIYRKYKFEEIKEAHIDLENRKILGPAIITP